MKIFSSPRIWLLAALLALPFMVSNDSLWLDEGDTALYAVQPDFHAWCERLHDDKQADCQMPLALLCSWVSGKIWGSAEWQLRAINLIWGALALIGMYRVGQRLKIPWLPLLLAIQPYFWFYNNEARPYALQLACGTWLLVALVEFYFARAVGTIWAWLLVFAGFFLFCATLLAPLPVAATVFAAAIIAWRQGWKLERKAIMILLGGILACLPVGIYYLTTLLRGAKGAQVWHVDLKFFAYDIYEFTGMGGIGLTEPEIRELARSPHLLADLSARAPQLFLPILAMVLLAAIFFLGLRRCAKIQISSRLIFGFVLALGLTSGVFFTGSLILQKAFWARHFAPVFPFYVALLGVAIAGVWPTIRLRGLPIILCALFIWSALNFRFAPALRKEDYRSASQFAREALAENKSVWWLAGGFAAEYYGLHCAYFYPEPGKIFVAFRSQVEVLNLPLPDVVVCNRPDIHDAGGVVQKIVAQNNYRVAARYQEFIIWTNAAAR